MSFESMLEREGGDVVLVTPAVTTDRNNNQVMDWGDAATRTTVQGWLQQTATSADRSGRDAITAESVLFLEPAAAPHKHGRAEIGDDTFEAVDGKPRLLTRHGAPHHWEVDVKQVTG